LARRRLRDYPPQPEVSQYRGREARWRGILPHSQARQFGFREQELIMPWLRTAGSRFIRAGELDHSSQDGRSHIWDRNDSEAPPFDLSQYRRVAMGDDTVAMH
jgi:hypothetical protein